MTPGKVFAIAAALAMPIPAQAATLVISMENLEIAPAHANARVGDTIRWVNKDVFAHTATARNGDFDVMLPANKTATLLLKKAGAIDYYCRFHPNMKATLTVAP